MQRVISALSGSLLVVAAAGTLVAAEPEVPPRSRTRGELYLKLSTGLGLTHHTLVTVIARDCATADSLATAVSVLGPEGGSVLVKATPGVAFHLVGKPRDRTETTEA